MTLEQTVNDDAASCQTGIGSFTHSEGARKRWMGMRAVWSEITDNLLSKAGISFPHTGIITRTHSVHYIH